MNGLDMLSIASKMFGMPQHAQIWNALDRTGQIGKMLEDPKEQVYTIQYHYISNDAVILEMYDVFG